MVTRHLQLPEPFKPPQAARTPLLGHALVNGWLASRANKEDIDSRAGGDMRSKATASQT